MTSSRSESGRGGAPFCWRARGQPRSAIPRSAPGMTSGMPRRASAACATIAGSTVDDARAQSPAGVATSAAARIVGSGQRAIDSLARLQQLLHRVDRDLEIGLGLVVQFDLDDLLDAAGADDAG